MGQELKRCLCLNTPPLRADLLGALSSLSSSADTESISFSCSFLLIPYWDRLFVSTGGFATSKYCYIRTMQLSRLFWRRSTSSSLTPTNGVRARCKQHAYGDTSHHITFLLKNKVSEDHSFSDKTLWFMGLQGSFLVTHLGCHSNGFVLTWCFSGFFSRKVPFPIWRSSPSRPRFT